MNKSSIEKTTARAIFHGSEFGKYNNLACKHKSTEERVACAIDKSQGV